MTPHPGRTYLERDPQHSRHAWIGVVFVVVALAVAASVVSAHFAVSLW